MNKVCFNLTAVLHWRRGYFEDISRIFRGYFEDFAEGFKSFVENFAVDFVEDFVKDLFQRCREAVDRAKLTRQAVLRAVLLAVLG